MTKRFMALIIAVLICAMSAVSVFASEDIPSSDGKRLYDGADILTDSEETELLSRLDKVSNEFKVDIAIVTVDGTGDMSTTEYVNYYYDNSGLGFGDDRDGVLFLIDMDARNFRIWSNGQNLGAAAISSDDIQNITDQVSSDLTDGNYVTAFNTYIDECEYQINGHINGFPFKTGKNIVISLVIGFVVAFIVTGVMKGKLKSVRKQAAASNYVKNGSLAISESKDTFLYSRITRTAKPTKSSGGSSGGSSRNVGGGSF